MEYKKNSIIMEYQKTINLLVNTPKQTSKFRTKTLVEVNNESRGTYNVNSQIKFKTSTLRLSLGDYSDVYILVNATITLPNTAAAWAAADNTKNTITENRPLLTNCISEINHTQIDNVEDTEIVMPRYN